MVDLLNCPDGVCCEKDHGSILWVVGPEPGQWLFYCRHDGVGGTACSREEALAIGGVHLRHSPELEECLPEYHVFRFPDDSGDPLT